MTFDKDGEIIFSLYFELHEGRAGFVHNELSYRVGIEYRTQPNGAIHVFWRCPNVGCEKRVRKLYRYFAGGPFACRQCLRLTYRKRRETAEDRRLRRYNEAMERGEKRSVPVVKRAQALELAGKLQGEIYGHADKRLSRIHARIERLTDGNRDDPEHVSGSGSAEQPAPP